MGYSAGIQEHDKIKVARVLSAGMVSPAAGAAMLAAMGGKKVLEKATLPGVGKAVSAALSVAPIAPIGTGIALSKIVK